MELRRVGELRTCGVVAQEHACVRGPLILALPSFFDSFLAVFAANA